jgi:hypothetical protein
MLSSFTWNAHTPRSTRAMAPGPGAGASGSQPRPTNVGAPVSGVFSSVSGGVALAWAATNSVPALGPDVIDAKTRNGLKSSSVASMNRPVSGVISDWWALPSGSISCPRARRSSSRAAKSVSPMKITSVGSVTSSRT